MVISSFY